MFCCYFYFGNWFGLYNLTIFLIWTIIYWVYCSIKFYFCWDMFCVLVKEDVLNICKFFCLTFIHIGFFCIFVLVTSKLGGFLTCSSWETNIELLVFENLNFAIYFTCLSIVFLLFIFSNSLNMICLSLFLKMLFQIIQSQCSLW